MAKIKKNYEYYLQQYLTGNVPTEISSLRMADRKGNTVAHRMALDGHIFHEPRIQQLQTGKRVSVLEVMITHATLHNVDIPHDLTEMFMNHKQKDTDRYKNLWRISADICNRIEAGQPVNVDVYTDPEDVELYMALTSPSRLNKRSSALQRILMKYVPKNLTMNQCEEFWKLGITYIYHLAVKHGHPIWQWDLPEWRFQQLFSKGMCVPYEIGNLTHLISTHMWREYLTDLGADKHRHIDAATVIDIIETFNVVGEEYNNFDEHDRANCPEYGTSSAIYKMLCNLPDDVLVLTVKGDGVINAIVSLFEYLPEEFSDLNRELNGFTLGSYISKEKKLIMEDMGDKERIRVFYS